jgi:undecaprenyl-diphosphatase
MLSTLHAIILGLVEGITEFLPVSSTGHLILTRALLGLQGAAVDRLLIVIQGAAILAVCWEFRQRLWDTAANFFRAASARSFVLNLLIAFLPLAVLGLLFQKPIERLLFAPLPVAIALVVGGVLILWAERRPHNEAIATVDQLRPMDALKLFHAAALIPGTSRSAATILGGLLLGMSRRAATEFSFFLAIPTLLAATAYKLWEARHELQLTELQPLAISSVVAFVSALIAVRLLMRFVSSHSFAAFAWYRIIFGGIVLATFALGWLRW